MIQALRQAVRQHGVRGFRFALVGALNTGIDIGVFTIAFYVFGWPLLVANAAGFVLGVSNSYFLNKIWTFADRSAGREALVRGLVFLGTSIIGLALGSLSIWLLAQAMPAILAKIATVGITFVWNFWASSRFVFRETKGCAMENPAAKSGAPMPLVEHQRTLYTSRNPTRRWLHTSRRDWIFSAIRRHAPARRTRAIEIGPGSGVYLPLLLELFDQVTAFDIEAEYLAAAQSLAAGNPALNIERGDITKSAGAETGSYDLVLCSEVIEHIPPEQSTAAFAGFRRLLADGGILVLSTPHRWSAIEATARIALSPAMIWLTRLIYREPVLEMGHINLLTRRQAERALHDAGFEIVERYAGGLYLPVLAELFGGLALTVEQWLEARLRGGLLHQLLWTQYYVARAAVADTA